MTGVHGPHRNAIAALLAWAAVAGCRPDEDTQRPAAPATPKARPAPGPPTPAAAAGAVTTVPRPAPAPLARLDGDRIVVGLPVEFEADGVTLREDSREALDDVAVLVGARSLPCVAVDVHTDARGAAAYNRDVSRRRAEAVMRHLVMRGVAADRLVGRGHGEDEPLPGPPPEAVSRVVLTVVPDGCR